MTRPTTSPSIPTRDTIREVDATMINYTLDRINYVSVTDLLDMLTDSCDFDVDDTYHDNWLQDMLASKCVDPTFWQLCETIPVAGFTVPICVMLNNDGTWKMGNGHHRLAAAILLCLDEIPVYVSGDNDFMHMEVSDPCDREYDEFRECYVSRLSRAGYPQYTERNWWINEMGLSLYESEEL